MTHEKHDPELDRALCAKPPHLAIWLDHTLARLVWLYRDRAAECIVHNGDAGSRGHIHHHGGTPGSGHAAMDHDYMEEISQAIGAAEEILLFGPVEARCAFKGFLETHQPLQARRVMGMEAMDHAGTSEIAARARAFFAQADRMGATG